MFLTGTNGPRGVGIAAAMAWIAGAIDDALAASAALAGREVDERALTDAAFLGLASAGAPERVAVDLATNEARSGADIELVVIDRGVARGYLIQAKRLLRGTRYKLDPLSQPLRLLATCATPPVVPAGWPRKPGYAPIYLFYNAVDRPGFPQAAWDCDGILRTDTSRFGCAVTRAENIVSDWTTAATRTPKWSPNDFRPVSRPWLCLLCELGAASAPGCPRRGATPPVSPLPPTPPQPEWGDLLDPDGTPDGGEDLWPPTIEPRPLPVHDLTGRAAALAARLYGREPPPHDANAPEVTARLTAVLLTDEEHLAEGRS